VLQFGFNDYKGKLRDLPHNFVLNAIVYTGTHDNDTIFGWFNKLDHAAVKALSDYVGYEVTRSNVVACMIQMAYETVARNLVIPMQDILGLDSSHRINTPSTVDQNWKWRMLPNENTVEHMAQLLQYVKRYNR
jgi:4-alpha-glucanotransferase